VKKTVKNILVIVLKLLYYRNCSLKYLKRYDLPMLYLTGFFQRVLRINRSCIWPVHWTSTVISPERIERVGESSSPGRSPGQYIQAVNGISMGRHIIMAPGVKLISANHDLNDYDKHVDCGKIVIGDHCWLAADVKIMPGVHLQNHTVVAAGSVVTKSFDEPDILIGGVPARKLKKLGKYCCD